MSKTTTPVFTTSKTNFEVKRGRQGFCVCGFVESGSRARFFSKPYLCVARDERGSSVGYAILYAPRHDTFNATLLGTVCCHAALLNKSNTMYGCVCCMRKMKGYGVHSITANLANHLHDELR